MIYIQYLKIRERCSKINDIFPTTLLTTIVLEVFYKKMDDTIKQLTICFQDVSKFKNELPCYVPNMANAITTVGAVVSDAMN